MSYLKKIEFMNIYPSSRNNEYVFIAIVITDSGDRLMMYAPMCKIDEMSLSAEDNSYFDYWNNCQIRERKLTFGGEIFALKEGAGQDTFFTIYNLDQIGKKPTVSKEDVEKMFGCKIDG